MLIFLSEQAGGVAAETELDCLTSILLTTFLEVSEIKPLNAV